MSFLPTVKVLHPELEDGVTINESDLTDEHVLFDPKAETARRRAAKKAAKASATPVVGDELGEDETGDQSEPGENGEQDNDVGPGA